MSSKESISKKLISTKFKRLIKFCRLELPTIGLGYLALIVNAVTNLSFPWIIGEAVDQTRLLNNTNQSQQTFILGTLSMFTMASLASFIRVYSLNTATTSIYNRLRKTLFNTYLYKNQDFFDNNKKGQLISILEKDIFTTSEVLTEKLASGIRSINSVFNGSILLYTISPKLFSITISMLPFISIFAMKLAKENKIHKQNLLKLEIKLINYALERFTSITTVRLNGREEYEINNYNHLLDQYRHNSDRYNLSRARFMSFINMTTNVSLCLVLYIGGNMLRKGQISAGSLTKFAIQSVFVGLGLSV